MDREKVIGHLLIIRTWNEVGKAYAHDEMDRRERAKTVEWIDETLELLKEQEAKKVIIDLYGNYCPWCSTKTSRAMGVQKLHLGTKFCPYCGGSVKWE